MKRRAPIDMLELTRLTRAGQLDQAMALLRGTAQDRQNKDALHSTPAFDTANSAGVGQHPRLPLRVSPTPSIGIKLPAADALRGELERTLKPRFRIPRCAASEAESSPPLPVGARFELRNFTDLIGNRSYKLYIPASYNGTAVPLIVMLHGCTQSPDDFARGTRMNELAEERGWLVAWPAQSRTANSSGCWNWFNPADQQRGCGEPALIAGITRQIMRVFAVDPARIYVAGLSAGGAMAVILGAAYPDLYAAVGVHSGLARGVANDMPSAFSAMRSGGVPIASSVAVPTIIFHGDADTTVNPVNGLQVAAQASAAEPLRTTSSDGPSEGGLGWTRHVAATIGGRPILEQWLLHGVGHAWSGGSVAGSFVEPRGPDASRAMLNFFAKHSIEPASHRHDAA
ncbi:MAG: PHB depolymerase family esterase [Dokdonella sp.]